jgi:hypothetical protein
MGTNFNRTGGNEMIGHYIAASEFEHPIHCLCPGGGHTGLLSLQQGDIIEVINERKYTIAKGWHSLIHINKHWFVYISERDLEECCTKKQLLNSLDIDLELNYLHFKINEALDTGNKTDFHALTRQLKEMAGLKESIENYLKFVAA